MLHSAALTLHAELIQILLSKYPDFIGTFCTHQIEHFVLPFEMTILMPPGIKNSNRGDFWYTGQENDDRVIPVLRHLMNGRRPQGVTLRLTRYTNNAFEYTVKAIREKKPVRYFVSLKQQK